jgi:hypothetical protein
MAGYPSITATAPSSAPVGKNVAIDGTHLLGSTSAFFAGAHATPTIGPTTTTRPRYPSDLPGTIVTNHRHSLHWSDRGPVQREVGVVHCELLHPDHGDGPVGATAGRITVVTPGGKGKSKTNFTVT